MTQQNNAPADRPGPLDRFLCLFAPVHRGESGIVLLMALNVFLLMTAYYFIKPVRDALILASAGAEVKTYASTGQALILLGLVPLYSKLAAAMPRRRLIATVLLFFAACLVCFCILGGMRVPLGIPFFLWVGIFNFMVVAQFWSFANDIYTPAEGKRLFAVLGFGMSFGAFCGSFIAGRLIEPLGLYIPMLFSGVLLVVSLVLTWIVDSRKGIAGKDESQTKVTEKPEDMAGPGGFTLLLRSRYLLLIAAMMILLNFVNTTGEYILGERIKGTVETSVPELVRSPDQTDEAWSTAQSVRQNEVGKGIGRIWADFYSIVNIAGLLIQLFLVSRIVQFVGVRWAILVLPVIAMGSYALIAAFPLLAVVRWGKTAENATDYSLQNTVRNMLFLPTTRQEKYKAKQAIDTFCTRTGDAFAALLVFLGINWLHLSPTGFAGVNVGLAVIWIAVVWAIGTRFKKLTEQ